jgi:hypothetical protein
VSTATNCPIDVDETAPNFYYEARVVQRTMNAIKEDWDGDVNFFLFEKAFVLNGFFVLQ